MKKFEKNPYGSNEILYIDERNYFSFYNFATDHSFGAIFNSDNSSPETALCIKNISEEYQDSYKNKKPEYDYFILNGDFRAECEKMIEQEICLEDIKRYFEIKSKEFGSSWSSPYNGKISEVEFINFLRQRGFDV